MSSSATCTRLKRLSLTTKSEEELFDIDLDSRQRAELTSYNQVLYWLDSNGALRRQPDKRK